MKMLRKYDGSRKSGFTLIELLTVIVIIGVLAGMISTAIMLAKRKSLEVAREAELVTIKSAIDAYRFEYQEWPAPAAGVYQDNNKVIISDWLMNDVDTGRNERKIKFLNLGDYRTDPLGNLVDYAGNKYKITFDFTNDTVKVE